VGDRRFQAEIEQALGRRVTKSTAGRPKAQPEHRRGATRLAMESWSVPYSPYCDEVLEVLYRYPAYDFY
jgi:hypothetical protein